MEYSCGNTEAYRTRSEAMAAEVKLQTNRPLYLIKEPLPGKSRDETAELYERAFKRWGKADIKTRRITDQAEAGPNDVVNLITAADLGGGGVLADQMLPNGSEKILQMRMNTRIKWMVTDSAMSDGIDPVRVFCHEQGHFLGHEHWPKGPPAELMEPFISDDIIAPQPTEVAVTIGWFGKTGEPDPPPPPPPQPKPCGTINDCLKSLTNALQSIKRGQEFTLGNMNFTAEAAKGIQSLGNLSCDQIIPLLTLLQQLCRPAPAILPCIPPQVPTGCDIAAILALLQKICPR